MAKKHYIILGDNNFWYTAFTGTKEDIPTAIEEVKQAMKDNQYNDHAVCNKLYVYEIYKYKPNEFLV